MTKFTISFDTDEPDGKNSKVIMDGVDITDKVRSVGLALAPRSKPALRVEF